MMVHLFLWIFSRLFRQPLVKSPNSSRFSIGFSWNGSPRSSRPSRASWFRRRRRARCWMRPSSLWDREPGRMYVVFVLASLICHSGLWICFWCRKERQFLWAWKRGTAFCFPSTAAPKLNLKTRYVVWLIHRLIDWLTKFSSWDWWLGRLIDWLID